MLASEIEGNTDNTPFYKEIIFYWQDITTATPKNKNEVLSQPIWNNRFLTVNKKMVFYPHWHQAGIKQISDLFDSCEGQFLPFNSFCNKFNVKCNFLQYYSILSRFYSTKLEETIAKKFQRPSYASHLNLFTVMQSNIQYPA